MFSFFKKKQEQKQGVPRLPTWEEARDHILPLPVSKEYVRLKNAQIRVNNSDARLLLSAIEDIPFTFVINFKDFTMSIMNRTLEQWGISRDVLEDATFANYERLAPTIPMHVEYLPDVSGVAFLNTTPNPPHDFVATIISAPRVLFAILSDTLKRESYLLVVPNRFSIGVYQDSEVGLAFAETSLQAFLYDCPGTDSEFHHLVSKSIYRLTSDSFCIIKTLDIDFFDLYNIKPPQE